jgi:[ribosomal protein S5]-alanine N-acetyltransferase
MKLIGKRIFIKILSPDDVNQAYVEWMNDPAIHQYLESRFRMQTIESVRSFVEGMNNSTVDAMFGIFLNDSSEHIGNIKIGNINPFHRRADVGLIIGNRSAWGKGYAAEAIALVTQYGFEELNLNKLFAGMYAENTGSFKAFLKCGWRHVGTLKEHCFSHGKYTDEFIVEICKSEYSSAKISSTNSYAQEG